MKHGLLGFPANLTISKTYHILNVWKQADSNNFVYYHGKKQHLLKALHSLGVVLHSEKNLHKRGEVSLTTSSLESTRFLLPGRVLFLNIE